MEENTQEKKKRAKAAKPAATKTAKKAPSRTKRQQGDTIFALDIGTRTVVGILAEKTDSGYSVIDMETAAHEKRSMTDGQIEDIEAVSEVIKTVKAALEKRGAVKLSHVCIAAAGRALKTMRAAWEYKLNPQKSVTEDDLKAAELEAVRRTEEKFSSEFDTTAFYCVGHSVISRTLDGYKVQKPEGHRGELLETEIIAAFLPAYVVESLCAAVDSAGLDVAGLTLEPIAAMNVVVPPELRLINVALCDIGAGTSDVAVSRDGSVVAYGMATTAGDEITEHLMKELLVDFATAEYIKTCDLPEIEYTDILLMPQKITEERLSELLLPVTEELCSAICSEILAANSVPPQAVFLVGGGSKLKRLPELVAKGLGISENRVVVGRRELMRGITAPKNILIGTEHATPLGIAVTASEGVAYDFTTITLNGKKIRALDTNRLTVIELLNVSGFKTEKLIGKSGSSLTFTLNGEKVTLRGTPAVPAEIFVNGKPAALNTTVRKGDEVNVIPAKNGESAAAYLSDYFEFPFTAAVPVTLLGEELLAGTRVIVNGKEADSDCEIENGDIIQSRRMTTLGELLSEMGIDRPVLLNGRAAAAETLLCENDIITEVPEPEPIPEPVKETVPPAEKPEGSISITVNGITADFPPRADGKPIIFLDVAAAFSDDPTLLLSKAKTITVNGKIARLDEEIHDSDVIIIE